MAVGRVGDGDIAASASFSMTDGGSSNDLPKTTKTMWEIVYANTKKLTKTVWVIFSAVMFNNFIFFITGEDEEEGSSSDASSIIFLSSVPIIVILAVTIGLPMRLGHAPRDRTFQVVTTIGAHVTGWAFVNLFEASGVTGGLKSTAVAFVCSVLLCSLYYAVMDCFRRRPKFVERVGHDHEAVWEAILDFDQDVVSYVTGFLAYSLGLQIVVKSARSEEGSNQKKGAVDVSPYVYLFLFFFLLASACTLAIVQGITWGATHRLLIVLPKLVTQTCAVALAFIYAEFVCVIYILQDGIYYDEDVEKDDDDDDGGGDEENDISQAHVYFIVGFCIVVLYTIYNFVAYRGQLSGKEKASCCSSARMLLRNIPGRVWYRRTISPRVRDIMSTGAPIAVGFMFEQIIEEFLDKTLPAAKHGWMRGIIYLLIAVFTAVIFVNAWKPEDMEDEEEEGGSEREPSNHLEETDNPITAGAQTSDFR